MFNGSDIEKAMRRAVVSLVVIFLIVGGIGAVLIWEALQWLWEHVSISW